MASKSRRWSLAVGTVAVGMGAVVPSVAQASVVVVDDDDPIVTIVDEGDPNHRVLLGATGSGGHERNEHQQLRHGDRGVGPGNPHRSRCRSNR